MRYVWWYSELGDEHVGEALRASVLLPSYHLDFPLVVKNLFCNRVNSVEFFNNPRCIKYMSGLYQMNWGGVFTGSLHLEGA